MRAFLVALVICAGLVATPRAQAQSYLWTDEQGRVHMTDDLSQVPSHQRARAKQAAQSAGSAAQSRFSRPAQPSAAPAKAKSPRSEVSHLASQAPAKNPEYKGAKQRFTLQFDPATRAMRVEAEVNGGVRVPFILDTGATSCSLPAWAAEALALEVDESTPTVSVVGISGQAQVVPQVEIDRLEIGELVVENLEMHILDTMQEGLLGMPFFNHFKVALDPTSGTLTLEKIDADTRDDSYGGKNEQTWRAQFKQRRQALDAVRQKIASIGHEYITIRERLEEREAVLLKQFEDLDARATRAGVPQSWRE